MNENQQPLYTLTVEQYKTLFKALVQENFPEQNHRSPQTEELMKMPELCKLLKVSKVTLFAWIKSGKLKAHHINSRLYFKRKDVEQALIHHKGRKGESSIE